MAEYIEREELKKVFSNEAVHCLTFQKKGEARGLIKAREIVSKLPAADVAEVVRCKDCDNSLLPDEHSCFCCHFDEYVLLNDFCSYGARRETE